MDKIDIKNISKDELRNELVRLGEKPYRAGQIFRWLYKSGVNSFEEMTDLGKGLRDKLKERFHITKLILADSKHSLIDGTVKYLFKLEDVNTIESVFLPEDNRVTLCLSSQVGCKFGCSFCASAPFGFIRDLKTSEILDEALSIRRHNPSSAITNIVFMGIGEPLDNYDNVMKSIRIMNDADAMKIGARKITISTCGLIPGMKRLAGEKLQVELSVSLHSADDKVRSALVPINKRYPLKELMAACKEYTKKTKRIITFEYILLKDMNSSKEDARKLSALLKGLMCKVNLIMYNQVSPVRNYSASTGTDAKGYKAPEAAQAKEFIGMLKRSGVNVMLRKSKGEDIDAGCGQLRISAMRPARG
ncbi:MAG: 23S rRNA (adenine(2503)-C(2))-methyltransferase RlmN [Candidatus Omnitrophica bacterium]|nr:23S rRNA (adenine(2503)-C(2))-methyltransferase RlmN [Candidatus Omnitrophota bacterium]